MNRRNMHLGAKPSVFRKANELRRNQTEAERILWQHLRNKQMEGIRFRRQHPMSGYVGDFYAHEVKFVIETDGEYHEDPVQKFYDNDRTENLKLNGLTILRFSNEEVLNNIEEVLSQIRQAILAARDK